MKNGGILVENSKFGEALMYCRGVRESGETVEGCVEVDWSTKVLFIALDGNCCRFREF